MNRSFEHVLNNSINHSKSKQTHAFPKQNRFKPHTSPACARDSYDLSKLDMAHQIPNRLTTTSLSPRFRYKRSDTPSPLDYKRKSFVDESREAHKGPKLFTHQRMKDNRNSLSPGPGAYNPIVKHSAPQISFSPRYEKDTKPKRKQEVSPAYYDTTNVTAVGRTKPSLYSKYSNVSFYKIGHEPRFKTKNKFDNNGPGSYNISADLGASRKVYSFGSEKRSKQKGGDSPGPGAYQRFSEFAERRLKLESKLHRLSELLTKK